MTVQHWKPQKKKVLKRCVGSLSRARGRAKQLQRKYGEKQINTKKTLPNIPIVRKKTENTQKHPNHCEECSPWKGILGRTSPRDSGGSGEKLWEGSLESPVESRRISGTPTEHNNPKIPRHVTSCMVCLFRTPLGQFFCFILMFFFPRLREAQKIGQQKTHIRDDNGEQQMLGNSPCVYLRCSQEGIVLRVFLQSLYVRHSFLLSERRIPKACNCLHAHATDRRESFMHKACICGSLLRKIAERSVNLVFWH